MDVKTWADGFGIWHAQVDERGVGDAAGAERAAREAIASELAQREGPAFDPGAAVGVELERRQSRDGVLTSFFVEVDPSERGATSTAVLATLALACVPVGLALSFVARLAGAVVGVAA